jgi:hypothetical protein
MTNVKLFNYPSMFYRGFTNVQLMLENSQGRSKHVGVMINCVKKYNFDISACVFIL